MAYTGPGYADDGNGTYARLLSILNHRPAPFEDSGATYWNDPHVSKGMLDAHLNPQLEGATREHAFVERSVEWIAGRLPPTRYARLLDLGCGPGLYAERFCARGYDVTGVDLSERSIAYAKNSAQDKNLSIRYRLENYLELREQNEYDLITLIYCGYGSLPIYERRTLLKNVHRALRPGGCFLLDVYTPREYRNRPECMEIQTLEKGFWFDAPHALIHSFFRFDDEKTYADRFVVITKSALYCHHMWSHAFTEAVLRGELLDAGFADIERYGNVAGAYYSKKGHVMCALAKKR